MNAIEKQVRAELADTYTAEGVEMWLKGRHKLMDNRSPLDLIENGEGDRVLQAVDALRSGAFV